MPSAACGKSREPEGHAGRAVAGRGLLVAGKGPTAYGLVFTALRYETEGITTGLRYLVALQPICAALQLASDLKPQSSAPIRAISAIGG